MNSKKMGISRRRLLAGTGAASTFVIGAGLASSAWGRGPAPRKISKEVAAGLDAKDPLAKLVKGGAATTPSDFRFPPHHEAIAREMLARARHSLAAAALNPKSNYSKNAIAAAGAAFLVGRPREAVRARASAESLFKQARTSKSALGRYAELQPKAASEGYGKIDIASVADWRKAADAVKIEKPRVNLATYSRAEFQLNSVKCLKTTDGWGADEIKLGGWLFTPQGTVVKINPFYVSENFTAGRTISYDFSTCQNMTPEMLASLRELAPGMCPNGNAQDVYRGRVLSGANLQPSGGSVYGLTLMMAEIDWGGFGSFLNDAYVAVKGELAKEVGKLAVSAAGVDAGSIEAIIIQIATWVVIELIGWLISWAEDDYMGQRNWMVQLPNRFQTSIKNVNQGGLAAPSTVSASPMKKLTYTAHGGQYEVRLHWRAS